MTCLIAVFAIAICVVAVWLVAAIRRWMG